MHLFIMNTKKLHTIKQGCVISCYKSFLLCIFNKYNVKGMDNNDRVMIILNIFSCADKINFNVY